MPTSAPSRLQQRSPIPACPNPRSFRHVSTGIKGYYNIWRDFDQGGKDWPATFANDHFLHHNGDCVSDAGAFAYLAKAIGYKKFMYVPTLCRATTMHTHGVRSTDMFMTRFSQKQRVTASITVQPMVLMDFTRF